MKNTAKEKAMEILIGAGCTEETYQGEPVDGILKDLKIAFPDGIEGGFSHEEIAEAIYAISTTDRGWKEPVQYEFDGVYAAHCGATDLYEPIEKELRQLVASGEPFKTCSLDSKKELCGWRMERNLVGGSIFVTVNQWMDEDSDLVYDALPDGIELTDEQIDEILDLWFLECGGQSETSESAELPGDSSLDVILENVNTLISRTNATLKESFEVMKGIVADYLEMIAAN